MMACQGYIQALESKRASLPRGDGCLVFSCILVFLLCSSTVDFGFFLKGIPGIREWCHYIEIIGFYIYNVNQYLLRTWINGIAINNILI